MPHKTPFSDLSAGFVFPDCSLKLTSDDVATYLKATADNGTIYSNGIPPLLIAARAMAMVLDMIVLPPGAIHTSQELDFSAIGSLSDTFTAKAVVDRKIERSKLRMLTIAISITNERMAPIVKGKTSFIVAPD
jgi:acyl dehydratase